MNVRNALAGATALVPPGVILMAVETVDEMQARLEELREEASAIVAAATADERDLNAEENARIDEITAEADGLPAKIERQKRIDALTAATPSASAGRKAAPEARNTAPNGGGNRVPATARNSRTLGFNNFGEFALTVRNAAIRDEGALNRLAQVFNTNNNEGVGEDGGFLVPPEYREGIMKKVEGEDSLLPLTDNSTTARNSVMHPKDETTPWGTAGIQAYWEGEASAAAATKAKFQGDTLRLNKLFARVDVTDELLEDAPQLDNYLRQRAPEVMTSVLNLAIVQGNGVGKPLGIMNAPCLVTVAKQTSQPADTIHHRNIVDMMGRMYGPSWTRAIWLMHQDVWAQLHLISFRDIGSYPSTLAGTPVPVFVPPSGISGAPYGTLMGRPIRVLQAMETIGDLGDIILADMKAYRTLTKAGGTRVDTSIHLKFDTDETVFRFIFRVAGAPWWSSAISPRDGSNTLSPFVTLASR